MTATLSGLVIGALAFAIAFGIAKAIAVKRRRRNCEPAQGLQRGDQSRQVRRAQERQRRR